MFSQKDGKSDDKQKDGGGAIGIVCRGEAGSSRKVVIIIVDELAFPRLMSFQRLFLKSGTAESGRSTTKRNAAFFLSNSLLWASSDTEICK